jgi:hypothetical protein
MPGFRLFEISASRGCKHIRLRFRPSCITNIHCGADLAGVTYSVAEAGIVSPRERRLTAAPGGHRRVRDVIP